MRLTVLGSSASFADAGRACAGYLVQSGETSILLDCGNGVLANLHRVADPLKLDAVVISHGHPDHVADLYALQAKLRYAPEGPAPAMPLVCPPGLLERLGCLLSERGQVELAEAFAVETLEAGRPVCIGGVTVVPHLADHSGITFALTLSDEVARLCYTADTAPGDAISQAAEGADLLLAEATLPQAYEGRAPHLTAAQAAEIARDGRVGRLVLTHVWPTNDRVQAARQAAERFDGAIDVAEEFDVYDIGA